MPIASTRGPDFVGPRGDVIERNLDAVGVLAALADESDKPRHLVKWRRGLHLERELRQLAVLPNECPVLPNEIDGRVLQVGQIEPLRDRHLGVVGYERVHAARRAAVDDADQPAARFER